MQLFRRRDWRHGIARLSPFRVGDVGTNCILHRADRDLLALAQRLGEAAAAHELEGWIARTDAALPRLGNAETGLWHSLDLVTGRQVPTATHAGFLAFWAGCGDTALARALEAWIGRSPFAVASLAPDHPRFDARRYWRGPIWAVVNFLIAQGLAAAGEAGLAARIRSDTRRLIATAGCYEYFDPRDGTGLGGGHVTWTAAIWLAWAGRAGASS